MAEFTIGVHLNSGQGRFSKYQRGDKLDFAFALKVEAENRPEALDVAYAVLNSYPEEMFCEQRYTKQVREYRMQGHRSLSAGDVLAVLPFREGGDSRFFAVARFGFDEVSVERFRCEECGWEFTRTAEEQEEAGRQIGQHARDFVHVGCWEKHVRGWLEEKARTPATRA